MRTYKIKDKQSPFSDNKKKVIEVFESDPIQEITLGQLEEEQGMFGAESRAIVQQVDDIKKEISAIKLLFEKEKK